MDLLKSVFPGWALSRARSRHNMQILERFYDAAQPTQYRKQPRGNQNANANMQNGGAKVRQFARNLDDNHDLAIGILDTLVNNIVGTGIPISPIVQNTDGKLNNDFNELIARVFTDWKRRPEASRTHPFDEMTRLICRTWLRDGEMLIQRIKGNTQALKHHSAIPYSLELIESDFLPYDLNTDRPAMIVQGVEVNGWSMPIAYRLLKRIPSDLYGVLTRVDDTRRIDADKIFHPKFTRRVSQVRGVSILHGVITRLDDIKNYEESERIAAQVAASMTGFIKKSPDMRQPQAEVSETASREFEMAPGMIFDDLLPGEEIGTISSDRPNTGLGDFRDAMLKAAASGTGTNYSSISKNYDGSYSSQRQSMIEALPGYEKMRNYFIEVFIRPMYRDFMDMALLSGAIRPPVGINRATLYDVDIRGVSLPWIDPKKEVQADVIAIDNGLKARPDVIREHGGDPIEVKKQIDLDDFKPKQTAAASVNDA